MQTNIFQLEDRIMTTQDLEAELRVALQELRPYKGKRLASEAVHKFLKVTNRGMPDMRKMLLHRGLDDIVGLLDKVRESA